VSHLPLDGQGEREPDGRGVEQRWYDLVHGVPRVARLDRRQRLVVVAERVHVEQPRGREQQREHVGQGHGHEHHVGGRSHVPLGQHDHDQSVGHDGHQQQERHDEPVHGPGVPDRHLGGHVQIATVVGLVAALRRSVEVEQARQVRGHHCRIVFLVHRISSAPPPMTYLTVVLLPVHHAPLPPDTSPAPLRPDGRCGCGVCDGRRRHRGIYRGSGYRGGDPTPAVVEVLVASVQVTAVSSPAAVLARRRQRRRRSTSRDLLRGVRVDKNHVRRVGVRVESRKSS